MNNKTKPCSTCKVDLPLSAYSKYAEGKDGLQHKCKECTALYHTAYYAKTKERKSVTAAAYYQRNKEKLKKNNSAYYYDNHEKCKAARLKSYYDRKVEAFDK